MRTTMLILLVLSTSSAPSSKLQTNESPEQIVRVALDLKSQVIYTGIWDKLLSRIGDAGAVAVTKVVGGKDLTPEEVNRILAVIWKSFGAPRIVQNAADRRPRTALFVLKYLDSLDLSPELKARVAQTRAFVERQSKSATIANPD